MLLLHPTAVIVNKKESFTRDVRALFNMISNDDIV
jgi:hypothetical protein